MSDEYDDWNTYKQTINAKNGNHPCQFNEREVWWCAIGMNVGHEIFGKGKEFARPVLIFKKYNNNDFFGIPFTTKLGNDNKFHLTNIKGKKNAILFNHARSLSSLRLIDKICKINMAEFEEITVKYIEYMTP